jgi:hypothetical protein
LPKCGDFSGLAVRIGFRLLFEPLADLVVFFGFSRAYRLKWGFSAVCRSGGIFRNYPCVQAVGGFFAVCRSAVICVSAPDAGSRKSKRLELISNSQTAVSGSGFSPCSAGRTDLAVEGAGDRCGISKEQSFPLLLEPGS